jgi:chromate transport protein ChrA
MNKKNKNTNDINTFLYGIAVVVVSLLLLFLLYMLSTSTNTNNYRNDTAHGHPTALLFKSNRKFLLLFVGGLLVGGMIHYIEKYTASTLY